MKKIFILLPILCCLINCGSFDWAAFNQGIQNALELQYTQSFISQLDGSVIIAEDGTYLGKITDKYDSESIFNQYGTYGSKYSQSSIWNQYGTYGGKYSAYSTFNPYTSTPPKIYKNRTYIGYLTVNKYLDNAINPYILLSYFQ